MATIDLKLKTYEQLQFEVMNLNTKNYLQQQELDKYKNIVDDIEKYIRYYKVEDIEEKTMLILNDILLIKNGMSDSIDRLKGE